ncbi:MAG: DUF1292 domain-containing protein [Eubacteriales bacterium]|nr:DUF1292 domain-containing protein [Eubacteriales bacterium]
MSRENIIEKTNALLAGHCAEELRTAAQAWLEAVGTEEEVAKTDEYIVQLEDGIMPIDDVIAFFTTDMAAEKFGPEMAAGIADNAKKVKANGGEWCDCPACTLAKDILGLFDDEDEEGKMILEFEDGATAECDVVCIFEAEDQTIIVLLDKESNEVLFYGYKENEDDTFDLYDLSDEEFDAAAKAFDEFLAE